MVGLRKGHSYTNVKRAYTRRSKYKVKGYIKAIPASKLVRYDMGDTKKIFPYCVHLINRDPIQVRHNSLESGRLVVSRRLGIFEMMCLISVSCRVFGKQNDYWCRSRSYADWYRDAGWNCGIRGAIEKDKFFYRSCGRIRCSNG